MMKKGISNIVAMVLGIVLVVAVMVVVFNLTKSFVQKPIDNECGLDLVEKLSLSRDYACYSGSEVLFSIDRGDIDLDKILVSISSESASQVIEMRSIEEDFQGKLVLYPERNSPEGLKWLPEEDSGMTYIFTGWNGEMVVDIKIAPIINGERCEAVDTMTNIPHCDQTTLFE